MSIRKTFFITGCSSGIGLALAEHALSRGHQVVATLRDPAAISHLTTAYTSAQLLVLQLDITSSTQITTALQTAVSHFGNLDVIINNAGWTLVGELEVTPVPDARKIFDIIYWGTLGVVRESLPIMRNQGGGRMINISSVAAFSPMPALPYFSAAKAALDASMDALRTELDPKWNIHVQDVLPGGFATQAMIKGSFIAPSALYEYPNSTPSFVRSMLAQGGSGDTSKAAQKIIEFAIEDPVKFKLILGEDAEGIVRGKLASLEGDMEFVHV